MIDLLGLSCGSVKDNRIEYLSHILTLVSCGRQVEAKAFTAIAFNKMSVPIRSAELQFQNSGQYLC
jgi:hypothetical protein